MKMDRDINKSGKGKYAIVNMRKIAGDPRSKRGLAKKILEHPAALDFGISHSADEFFLIRLKDRYAQAALDAYADACAKDDPEFSAAVRELAKRSGPSSIFCKTPD